MKINFPNAGTISLGDQAVRDTLDIKFMTDIYGANGQKLNTGNLVKDGENFKSNFEVQPMVDEESLL